MKKELKKVTMNLSDRTINNVEKLSELTGQTNKTRIVSSALEIAKEIITLSKKGKKIIVQDENGEKQELKFIL